MRWFSGLVVAAIIGFTVLGIDHANASIVAKTADCGTARCPSPAPVKTLDDGYEYSYEGASRSFQGVSRTKVAGKPGATYMSQYVIDCGQPQPPADPQGGDVGALDCARAACQAGPLRGRWMVIWVKQTAPVNEPVFTAAGRFCQVVQPPIPVVDITAAARDYVREHMDPALPMVQPGERTLVNFPNIVSTPDAGEQTFAIAEPLPGIVTVRPTYAWQFISPDGSTTHAEGVGRPYDGTSPRTGPAGHYLTATFRHSGTGQIELTATWTGTVTVQANAPVPLDPLVFAQDADLVVEQRRPVLLDPH